jgi:hypothetical protein
VITSAWVVRSASAAALLILPSWSAAVGAQGPGVRSVVMFASWRDPREGAFTLRVPQGWRVTGGASRRSAVDVIHAVRAASPDGAMQVFLNDPSLVPRQVPDAMMQRMGGLREGQTIRGAWGGPLLLERFRTGAEFARDYVRERLCGQPVFTGGGDRSRETALMNERQVQPMASVAGVRAQASIGDVYFRCGDALGYVSATTVLSAPLRGPGAVVWVVFQLGGFLAGRPADPVLGMYVLHVMSASFAVDPRWEARSRQEASALTASVARMQSAMAASLAQEAASRAAAERASVVGDKGPDVMSGWEARQRSMDSTFERGAEIRRGVTIATDPVHGSRTVSNAYNYYWVRGDGSIVGTMTDASPGPEWRKMSTP